MSEPDVVRARVRLYVGLGVGVALEIGAAVLHGPAREAVPSCGWALDLLAAEFVVGGLVIILRATWLLWTLRRVEALRGGDSWRSGS